MSVTGSTSVMPYGVCARAAGSRASTSRRSRCGIGAPALMSSRTEPRAARWPAVELALRVDHLAKRGRRGPDQGGVYGRAASASRAAVRVAGAVTSMSGTAEAMPMAGP